MRMDPIQAEIDALLQGPGGEPMMGGQPQQQGAMPPELGQMAGGSIDYIRGPDGQIAGARIGRMMVKFGRGQDGRISGMQVVGQSPLQLPQAQDPNAAPGPFG